MYVHTKQRVSAFVFRINQIFPKPKLVTSQSSKQDVLRSFQEEDLLNQILLRRPDTKFRLVRVINVRMKLFPLRDESGFIGAAEVVLPDYLVRSRSVLTLRADRSGRRFRGNDCLFRAFLVHTNGNQMPREAREKLGKMKEQYAMTWGLGPTFDGHIRVKDLIKFESTFAVRVVLYTSRLDANGKIVGKLLRASPFTSLPKNKTMFCDYCNGHVSLITKIETYCQSHVCSKCNEYMTNDRRNLRRHMSKFCSGLFQKTVLEPRLVRYQPRPSLFDDLIKYGIEVQEEQRYCKELSTWDLESLAQPVSKEMNTSCWTYVNQQVVCAASVKSTLAPFDRPVCFLSETLDPKQLVSDLVDYFLKVSDEGEGQEMIRLQPLFDQLDTKIETCLRMEEDNSNNDLIVQYNSDTRKQLESMKNRLLRQAKQHTFFGFNSSTYTKRFA